MQECPYPEQFNTETMECENFEKVECGKRKDTKDACKSYPNKSLRKNAVRPRFYYKITPCCLNVLTNT